MSKLDKNEILSVLEDWNFWSKELRSGFVRTAALKRLQSLVKNRQILILTGPRRAGKSFLMRQLLQSLLQAGVPKNQTLMINFEDPRWATLEAKDLESIFKTYFEVKKPKHLPYLFLDEIQEVHHWEKWVRMMHELDKAKIIISGSNSKLLSQELGTVLTGRHMSQTLFPFSYSEIQKNQESSSSSNTLSPHEILEEMMKWGAFPEVTQTEEADRKQILLQYFEDILHRDLIRRYKIRRGEALKSLARFYFSNISSLSTYSSIEKFLDISTDTIEKFSHYFEEAYLFFFLKRFSYKVKEQEKSPRKVYAIDLGLVNALGFQTISNESKLLENFVFLELKRKTEIENFEIYYWKDEQHREVDFLIRKNLKVIQLIQVSYLVESRLSDASKTLEREKKSLLKAMKEFKLKEGWVVTWDYSAEEKYPEGVIRFVSLEDWLNQL